MAERKAPQQNAAVELFWKIHPQLYRWSGGRIGGRLMGMPVLLLTTRGRRTGRERTCALMVHPHGSAFVVIASKLGGPRDPAWWKNLEARPEAEVRVGSRRLPVRARRAEGAERAALWREVADTQPEYDAYAERTSREIPVVVLERR